jgi:hypothetical protein
VTVLRWFLRVIPVVVLLGCSTVPTAPATGDALLRGWEPAVARTRQVGLGLPGGAILSSGVEFSGGVELVAGSDSPLHGLSDLKLIDESIFLAVSDNGYLVRGRLRLDDKSRLVGLAGLAARPLTDMAGSPLTEPQERDAEALAVLATGELLVAFERDHRIWSYGPVDEPGRHPTPAASPDFAFPLNSGMEGLSAGSDGGWRVAGESGGVWDCGDHGCRTMAPPPQDLLPDSDYRITGMDRDPLGPGWFVIQRSFSPPFDVRARVRRMDVDGALGPVLIELKLPGVTDNFEGIAAVASNGATRLYVLSDDNNQALQRTLLLTFELR